MSVAFHRLWSDFCLNVLCDYGEFCVLIVFSLLTTCSAGVWRGADLLPLKGSEAHLDTIHWSPSSYKPASDFTQVPDYSILYVRAAARDLLVVFPPIWTFLLLFPVSVSFSIAISVSQLHKQISCFLVVTTPWTIKKIKWMTLDDT